MAQLLAIISAFLMRIIFNAKSIPACGIVTKHSIKFAQKTPTKTNIFKVDANSFQVDKVCCCYAAAFAFKGEND